MTRLLAQAGDGNPRAADALLPLVYEHLRKIAQQRVSEERAGYTLEATALVHEAYLRLVGERAELREAPGVQSVRRLLAAEQPKLPGVGLHPQLGRQMPPLDRPGLRLLAVLPEGVERREALVRPTPEKLFARTV